MGIRIAPGGRENAALFTQLQMDAALAAHGRNAPASKVVGVVVAGEPGGIIDLQYLIGVATAIDRSVDEVDRRPTRASTTR